MTEHKFVEKKWGNELWICNFPTYCGKILTIHRKEYTSWHYHKIKDEVMYVLSGKVKILYGYSDNIGECEITTLSEGESFHVKTGLRHRIEAIERSIIIEFSTHHEDSDSIRILK